MVVEAKPTDKADRAAISVSRDMTFLQAARQLNLVDYEAASPLVAAM